MEEEQSVLRWGGLAGILGGITFILVFVVVIAFVGADLDRVVVANVGDRFLSVGDLGVRGQPVPAPVFD